MWIARLAVSAFELPGRQSSVTTEQERDGCRAADGIRIYQGRRTRIP